MDHVRTNLDQDLSLELLAGVAGFSPFHFHRVFKGVTGETVAQFTRRARLERAVDLMRGAPKRSLASIGAEVGFATPSEFARVFKATYGLAPSRWDRRSRFDAVYDITNDADGAKVNGGPDVGNRLETAPVCLRRRPRYRVAYVRVRDPWVGDNLGAGYAELCRWGENRGLDRDRMTIVGLSWENGKTTPTDRLVYDLGIAVAGDGTDKQLFTSFAEDNIDLPVHDVPAVTAAEVCCRTLTETAFAWEHMYRDWLPTSGFEPADHPTVKFFRTTPPTLDHDAWHVDCSIALRRALVSP